MTWNLIRLSICLMMAWPGVAPAQVSSSPVASALDPEATSVEDVEVRGQVARRVIGQYARAVTGGPPGRLAPRWDDRLCVRVVDMDAEHAGLLKIRVETVAAALGLSPDRSPSCRPDVSIYASNDPARLASALIEAAPRRFRPVRNDVTLGDAALEAFRSSDAAVRWWHVSLPVMSDTGQPAIATTPAEARDPLARSAMVRNGSRLRGNVRDDMVAVTIIIDIARVRDTPFNALSDYVALVALAPVDPRASSDPFDTVLNLFDRPGVTGLTGMDQDYLFALYSSGRTSASPGLQQSEIAARMAAERRRRAGSGN